MDREKFKESIDKVIFYLKFTGLYIQEDDSKRSLMQRFLSRRFYCFNFLIMNYGVNMIIFRIFFSLEMKEITRMIPCAILCYMGNFKSYFFISEHHHVINLINTLKSLQSMKPANKQVETEMIEKRLPFLKLWDRILLLIIIIGVAAFFLGCVLYTVVHYLKTNEIQFDLPFFVWYPFDEYSVNGWPFAYVHQIWAAYVTVSYVYGVDCFYFVCCVFIHLQYQNLKYDMERVNECFTHEGVDPDKFSSLIHRHRETMRCIDMINIVYGKSTFMNIILSSIVICVTGFNILAIDELLTMAPFTPFLLLGSFQILLFCYYGDLLMRDSVEISDAIYNSDWYTLKASSMKYCLFMLMRAQKPCRVSAEGFIDVNMRAYTKILSSAWSYFTLLRTMYVNKTDL